MLPQYRRSRHNQEEHSLDTVEDRDKHRILVIHRARLKCQPRHSRPCWSSNILEDGSHWDPGSRVQHQMHHLVATLLHHHHPLLGHLDIHHQQKVMVRRVQEEQIPTIQEKGHQAEIQRMEAIKDEIRQEEDIQVDNLLVEIVWVDIEHHLHHHRLGHHPESRSTRSTCTIRKLYCKTTNRSLGTIRSLSQVSTAFQVAIYRPDTQHFGHGTVVGRLVEQVHLCGCYLARRCLTILVGSSGRNC